MRETCGGYCCERFRIRRLGDGDRSYSYEEMQEWAQRSTVEEIRKVADMLVYLGYSALNGNGLEDERPSHWFTCKHFDTVTRLCKDYENCPEMCRNHGDEVQHCAYLKCQLRPREIPCAGEIEEKTA